MRPPPHRGTASAPPPSLFGRALGELEGLEVDGELLFAAALLHDTGLVAPPPAADFTLASAQVARQCTAVDVVGFRQEAKAHA